MKKTVTLNPGESKIAAFEITPTEARTYQVFVDGLTGSFAAIPLPVIGCTFTVINCPPAGAGYEAKFYTPTGAWVPCGGVGTIPFDMDKWRPWFLFIDIDRFSIVDGSWGGDIATYEEWASNMYNGKNYQFDWDTKLLTEIG